jgi:DNA-binding CsgD family transcriptional regulator
MDTETIINSVKKTGRCVIVHEAPQSCGVGSEIIARINDHALTEREKHVLDQLSQGLLYKEIAANAGISIETVRKHARHIYEKLQVSTRVEAIRKVYPGR